MMIYSLLSQIHGQKCMLNGTSPLRAPGKDKHYTTVRGCSYRKQNSSLCCAVYENTRLVHEKLLFKTLPVCQSHPADILFRISIISTAVRKI